MFYVMLFDTEQIGSENTRRERERENEKNYDKTTRLDYLVGDFDMHTSVYISATILL